MSPHSENIRSILECKKPCTCPDTIEKTSVVAITGGPGSGKTSFIDVARKSFCRHVGILPEAAGIIYNGGFPRSSEPLAIKAAQKSIWYVMRELEDLAKSMRCFHTILCDRGSLDGVAYWPEKAESFYACLGTSEQKEIERYALAIHLRTPSMEEYEGMNQLRIENFQEALKLDEKTMLAWSQHPKHVIIPAGPNFIEKVQNVIKVISEHLPTEK